jgi:hypothetical protein
MKTDSARIIEIIEKRRDALRDVASIGTASDPLVASAAQVAWEKAQEYDSLLAEIKQLPRPE